MDFNKRRVMKKLFILMLFSSTIFGQVDTSFIEDAKLINLNVYSPEKLKVSEYGAAYDVSGNLIYKTSDSSVYYSNGSEFTKLLSSSQEVVTGWAQYNGDFYDTDNKLVVTEGDTSTLYVNNSSVINSQLPIGVSSFYNESDTTIIGVNSGDAYLLRVSFKASSSINNGRAELLLDIGASPQRIIILGRNIGLSRGSNVTQTISSTSSIYSLNTFVANGCKVKIYADDGNISVWDISFLITRVHKAR